MDFTALTTAASTELPKVVAAIMAIGAIKFLPGVTRWGVSKVISWFN